jgi:hypothetical protein
MPEGMPDKVPECLPDRTPEDLPDRMTEDLPDRVPEDMPVQNAEDMPGRMPEDMPDRMPEDMPEKKPEDMSDRMPEDLPVTKRVDVMVGITRSKVIFSYSQVFAIRSMACIKMSTVTTVMSQLPLPGLDVSMIFHRRPGGVCEHNLCEHKHKFRSLTIRSCGLPHGIQ